MIYNLENEYLQISLNTYGAELNNIKSQKDNTEYLWCGNESHWKYHAPVLFPIVGKVINNKYTINGNTYELPQHGLARVSEFDMIEQTTNSISFELKYSDDTLNVYPYKFSLVIKYILDNNSIKVTYIVKNLDDKTMHFSIGAHPAFMCPLLENESPYDYYFEFNKNENVTIMELLPTGHFTNNNIPYLNNEKIIEFTPELFKNDALVFNNLKSNIVSLKSKNHSKSIDFDFTDFPFFAIWSKPEGAPFVCFEPWYGHSDYENFNKDFSQKPGIEQLDPTKIFNCTHTISIND